jgi:hypothetical protein
MRWLGLANGSDWAYAFPPFVLSLSKHERSGTAVVKPSPAFFQKRAARLSAWGQYVPAWCVRAPKLPQKHRQSAKRPGRCRRSPASFRAKENSSRGDAIRHCPALVACRIIRIN